MLTREKAGHEVEDGLKSVVAEAGSLEAAGDVTENSVNVNALEKVASTETLGEAAEAGGEAAKTTKDAALGVSLSRGRKSKEGGRE